MQKTNPRSSGAAAKSVLQRILRIDWSQRNKRANESSYALIVKVNHSSVGLSKDVRLELFLKDRFHPLLQALLVHLRRSRQTPLQFGIDSERIVGAALQEFFAGVADSDSHQWQDWHFATAALDELVAQCLRPQCGGHREGALISCGFPDPHSGFEMGLLASAAMTRECGAPTAEATPHSLVLWLERFYTLMSDVQPRAIDIVELRVEGFEDRDIAERLELGVRLVKQVVQDMRVHWGRVTGKE